MQAPLVGVVEGSTSIRRWLAAYRLKHKGRCLVSTGPVLVEQLAALLQRSLDLLQPVVARPRPTREGLGRGQHQQDRPDGHRGMAWLVNRGCRFAVIQVG